MATYSTHRLLSRAESRLSRVDALRAPLLGRFLRWRHARTAVQAVLLLLAALIVVDGLTGPQIAPENLAGVLPWVHWRGLLVLGLLVGGNAFCFGCPFMLPRRLAKRLFPATRPWPARLRNKWLAIALLILFFWSYETFDLWASPWLTAWVVLAYFAGAFAIDAVFQGAAFCKYVCPIGQFNFVNALVSPLEVRIRQPDICAHCMTKDCIAGHQSRDAVAPAPLIQIARRGSVAATRPTVRPAQAGCELWLFQERKVGNMDCTFCLDCVQACPHDNVGVLGRIPTQELWTDPRRSGVGRFGERPDLAALVLVLVFGAFLNAFGMVRPVYGFERWLAGLLQTDSEPLVLAVLFGGGLVALPALLVGLTAWASRAWAGTRESLRANALGYCPALAPLGLGMWAAHYSFHFLTGALTILPVAQGFLARLGLPSLGPPDWDIAALIPPTWTWLTPIAIVALEVGLFGTLLTLVRIAARRQRGRRAWRAALPWAILAIALFCAGVWLMMQPMEMRGTFLA
jgi:ferredoxin